MKLLHFLAFKIFILKQLKSGLFCWRIPT